MRACLALGIVLAVPCGGIVAGEAGAWWPQFHGPNRDNMSADTGLLKEWPPEGPPLLWKFGECGKGFSGVAIANGMIGRPDSRASIMMPRPAIRERFGTSAVNATL